MATSFDRTQRIVVLGGGPGGYEAALTGAQLGADVTLIERVGVGGAAVLTDVVPSKTLIATADAATAISDATWGLGLEPEVATLARWAHKGRVATLAELREPS